MKKYTSFIFDMDGTLVHNMHYHKDAWLQFLKLNGKQLSEKEWYAKNHGNIGEIIRRIFGEKFSDEEIFAMGEAKEALYRDIYKKDILPITGLKDFLSKCTHKSTALATMGDHKNIEFTLEGLDLIGYFDVQLGGEDAHRGKPYPDIFLQAADMLKVNPQECLVFEDSFSGIEAAKSAEMDVVVLATTHSREELASLQLDYIIEDYHDPLLNSFLK